MDSYEATRIVFSKASSTSPSGSRLLLLSGEGDSVLAVQQGGSTELTVDFGFWVSLRRRYRIRRRLFSGRWPGSGFSDHRSPMSPNGSLSYANVVNGSVGSSWSCLSPATFSYYGDGGNSSGDEYSLSFLNDKKGDDFIDYSGEGQSHCQSYSVPVVFYGSPPEDPSGGGFGWKPCLYFARGFYKNGSACRFLHDDDGDGHDVGSPEQCHEHLMRSKSAAFAAAAQQQKLSAASQFIVDVGAATFPYTKCVNFL